MASKAAQTEVEDPLYNLRLSIKASATPILSTSAEPTPANYVDDLARATHITFNVDGAHRTFDLTSDTRFAPDGKPVDLRSCYFAWVNKDASVTDYLAAVTMLNEELPGGAGGSVQNLTFAQTIELIAWLNGETESSDSIAAIDSGAATAAAGDAAAIAGGKGVPVDRNMKSTQGGTVDARLLQIYDGERNMGDHNTILRGNKPVVRNPISSTTNQSNISRISLLTARPLPLSSARAPILTNPAHHNPPLSPTSQRSHIKKCNPSSFSPHPPRRSSVPAT